MGDLDLHIATTLGLTLGICLLGGLFADFFRLPKVTAYLIVGLFIGPSFLDLVPEDHVTSFEPILMMAMAVVLFNLGCEFTFSRVREIAAHCLVLSLAEITCTFSLVTFGLIVFGCPVNVSLMLGCLAVATAPATTILVLKEFRSAGPVTESTGFLVAMNNFACIVLFELVFLAIKIYGGELTESWRLTLGSLVQNIAGSILLGIVGGLGISYGCAMLKSSRWLVLLVATSTFMLGICETLHIPYMLTFLAMGVTVANTSDQAKAILSEISHLSGLLAVVFFAVHGTDLDVKALLEVGMIGVIYIAFRLGGKWVGIAAASRLTKQPMSIRHWLGTCLFAQAGAAIALSAIAIQRDPTIGKPVQDVILGSVVVFEIIGPLFIRQALLRTGEVPISQAIRHSSSGPIDQLRSLVDRFQLSLASQKGTIPRESRMQVKDLMRDSTGIHQSSDFETMISYIEHSTDETYPIVDDDHCVVGVLRFPLLSDVMFDTSVAGLVCAEDLASTSELRLFPDQSVSEAAAAFQVETDDCIPVVFREEPHRLAGVIRRRDVVHAMIKLRKKSHK